MAAFDKRSGNLASKNEAEENPVMPCKGWIDPCEFCEKRFSQWLPADDESLAKVPSKPGILMLSLRNKSNTEIVTITVDTTNIQNTSFNEVDNLRQAISDKKSKMNKSSILVKWMAFKKPDDKDTCTLFAHWINYGVLPKYMKSWPGENFLKGNHHLMLSTQSQKWCYPKKDPVWKKTKPETKVVVEVVDKCNFFEPCTYCDDYFTAWKPLDVVVEEELAPDNSGICMFSVKYRKKREIIFIDSDPKEVAVNIKSAIKQRRSWIEHTAKDDKFFNPGNSYRGQAEVRWLEMSNPNDENSCFLYAHWLNSDTNPMLNDKMSGFSMPGEKVLERTKQFLLRTRDKKWTFELVSGKPNRFSKIKNKREILNQIEDEFPISK